MLADLHIHTCFSDGAQSSREVVDAAKAKGLSVISVCDHDTVTAYLGLRPICEAAGIRLIQGVELDVYWHDRVLHLLGYSFDHENNKMRKLMEKSRRELEQVSVQLIKNMLLDYPHLSLEDYEGFTYAPGEGGWKGIHYLRARGLTSSLMEGLSFYKKYGGYKPDYYSMGEACQAICEAGGIPVLAHPGCWWPVIPENFADILDDLRKFGMKGIECFYPEHTREMTEYCVAYCRAHNLRITCGGDGHGRFNNIPGDVIHDIGIMQVDMSQLDLQGIL
jgi:predicted metal-dependent phosphoesterase TrpH